MIIDHTHSLHIGVADGAAKKLKTALSDRQLDRVRWSQEYHELFQRLTAGWLST